ncbi:MAG: hypothetical protein P9X24_01825 [Candidatus Hatepunaea meridiana]|nr:hypothetical protein [Candidatus Hatepunaea meridiana]
MIVQYFVPHWAVNDLAGTFQQWAVIVLAFAYVLGVSNLVRINLDVVSKKGRDWQYKLITVTALLATLFIGLIGGITPGTFFNDRLYMSMYVPMSSTMYATLAFFIASAAYRAFRVKTWQAGLLAVTAVIVMLGRVPVGQLLWSDMPGLVDWVMEVPNMVAQRGILIGAALGAVATGLKMVFGIERSYLGRGK